MEMKQMSHIRHKLHSLLFGQCVGFYTNPDLQHQGMQCYNTLRLFSKMQLGTSGVFSMYLLV